MLESNQLEKSEIHPQYHFPASKYNRSLVQWYTRPYQQNPVQKHLGIDSERDFVNFTQKSTKIPEKMRLNPINQVDFSRFPGKNHKLENLGIPKGISTVTEKRLLARAEILNQRNQMGINAAQSLPRINESITLQLRANKNGGNFKNVNWSRPTLSEPTMMSQNRGAANAKWRLAAKAPVYYSSSSQAVTSGVGAGFLNRAPSRSSTASDYAWYRNSRVSDIWK